MTVNHRWRIIAAGISYTFFGLGAFVPVLYALILWPLPLSPESRQTKIRASIRLLARVYVDFMQFVGLMSYKVTGLPNRTVRGKLVIANHPMLIDALFVLAYVDNLCCIVKTKLCTNFFTRLPIKLAGYIPNDAPDLIKLTAQKLHNGENVLIFPEGTRNSYDTELNFKRGAANIALINKCDILPIIISCLPRALQKKEKWHELPTVKSRIQIIIQPVIRTQDGVDQNSPITMQYRQLTEFLRNYYLQEISKIK